MLFHDSKVSSKMQALILLQMSIQQIMNKNSNFISEIANLQIIKYKPGLEFASLFHNQQM